uniref:Hypothetical chloroplast RF20 n=1 Tax=Koliella corcontica TaxID=155904 RepID=A0A097KMX5_9CHLO|nr:hypothetical chloroplast RF20 [Koliella corcontica]AIT94532.1 hypothetical chloroplast RF20 [Koliella corcontica]
MQNTRIFKLGYLFLEKTKKYYYCKKNKFTINLFFLFIGFILGNTFGTFLNTLRQYFIWDGYIITLLLIFLEIINKLIYNNQFINYKNKKAIKNLNFIKIGILFGFFIDAFKVGS